jgi:LysR family transcriptional regulator, glycine cleavage system transcriptional activator
MRTGCRRTLPRKNFSGTHSFQYAARNCFREAPTWSRWLATARSVDPSIPDTHKAWDLSFREELHAIDAVAAGQGIAICSDVVVSRELKSGALVKAHALSLPGYGFYLVSVPDHPQRPIIEAFSTWMRSVV